MIARTVIRARRFALDAIFWSLVLAGSGCGDSSGPAQPGSIEVTVVTTGQSIDVDPDGYSLTLDGVQARHVGVNTTSEFLDITAGSHSIRVADVAPNCSLGTAERSVEVRDGEMTPVSFAASCEPNVGAIEVRTVTVGHELDTDGYSISFAGAGTVALPTNGTVNISGIRAGAINPVVAGLASNCVIVSQDPATAIVKFGTISITFTISCAGTASIQIKSVSTGSDFDPLGFMVTVRERASGVKTDRRLPANGTLTVSALAAGTYDLTAQPLSNCNAEPVSVSVAAAAQAEVSIEVACVAATRIAYVVQAGIGARIWVGKSNGLSKAPITMLSGWDADPAWSPDGSRIVFASDRVGDSELYVMNSTGDNATRLTSSPRADYRPAWSPDGSRIAFVSERDNNPEIYVMNADGSNAVNLTGSIFEDTEPDWSPDGTRIAFKSNRDGVPRIWIMNADGSEPARLSNGNGDRQPAWSPDGKRIAFSRHHFGDSYDIFVMNADGTGVVQLTSGLKGAADPAWSPDGSRIAVAAVTRDCEGWYYYYNCDPYIAIYRAGGGLAEAYWTFMAANPAWSR